MSSKLVTAIKRAANSLHNDVVENFTAIVIEPTDGSDHITRAKEQGMISVKQVTGKIITTYVEPAGAVAERPFASGVRVTLVTTSLPTVPVAVKLVVLGPAVNAVP